MLENRHLYIFLPKMTAHRRDFDETKHISLLIKGDELLEKHNEIWEKVKNSFKKYFDVKPVYNEEYLQTKMKSLYGKISANFLNKKMPKELISLHLFISNFDRFCF